MSKINTVLSEVEAPEVVQPVVYSPVPPEFFLRKDSKGGVNKHAHMRTLSFLAESICRSKSWRGGLSTKNGPAA